MRNISIFIDCVPEVIKRGWKWKPEFKYDHWPIKARPGTSEYISFRWLNLSIQIDNEW